MPIMKHGAAVLFFALAGVGLGQVPVQVPSACIQQGCYFATTSLSLTSNSASTLTIQQPAAGGRQVTLIAAVAQCAGQAFTIDQSQNGTGATATAGTAVPLIPIQVNQNGTVTAAAATIFTASNVGSGTATAPSLAYTAGDPRVIGLSDRMLTGSGIANNYNIKVTNNGGSTCTAVIAIYWREKV